MRKNIIILPRKASRYNSSRFPQIKYANVAYETDAPVLTPAEMISKEFGEMKTALETTTKGLVEGEVATQVKAAIEKGLAEAIKEPAMTKEVAEQLVADMKATIKGFDMLQTSLKGTVLGVGSPLLTVGQAVEKALKDLGITQLANGMSEIKELETALKSANGSIRIPLGPVDLKAQGSDMTTGNSLTGNPVRTYNQRQAIIPAQKLNFRDLMNTVNSPTGTYVTYTEDAGETNNIILQTEGSTKGQNQYTMTESVKTAGFIAGFSVFTRQLTRNLPFLQTTLPRLLLRDFYKVENASFYTTVSGAATGPTSGGSSPDDVKQLINLIAGFLNTDYMASYVVVNATLMGRLITSTYNNGYYAGAGTVILNGPENPAPISIFGVPIFWASWVPANKALCVDMDYLERVEVEGLNIAFSYEDATNFRQNKVTARIECQEAVNLMRPDAAFLADLGAS